MKTLRARDANLIKRRVYQILVGKKINRKKKYRDEKTFLRLILIVICGDKTKSSGSQLFTVR